MNNNIDSIIRIPCSVTDNFFQYWFTFLKPIHHLTNSEISVIAAFAKRRFELSKKINDAELLDKVTFSNETKQQVREDCNISSASFQVAMSKLRKNNVIVNNRINPRYLPNIKEENGSYRLLLYFDFPKV